MHKESIQEQGGRTAACPRLPNIIYEATLHNTIEPTGEPVSSYVQLLICTMDSCMLQDGVEITKCVGVEQES